jgi:hypothetical protein
MTDERLVRAHVYVVIAVTSLHLLTFVVISFAAIGTKTLSDAWNCAVHYSLEEASRLMARVFIRVGDRRPDLWPGIKLARERSNVIKSHTVIKSLAVSRCRVSLGDISI